MGRFGGYYKGEKKKGRKTREKKSVTSVFGESIFRLPEIVGRGKKGE